MSRGARIAGIVLWALMFGLPLLFAGLTSAREIIAWGVLAAIISAFGAVGWDAAAADTGAAPEEPEPAAERMSWKDAFLIALFITGVFMGLGSIVLIGDEGFGVLIDPVYWQVFGFIFGLSVLISILLRFSEVTRADVAADDARRRAARRGRPADLPLLRGATQEQRRDWHRRARHLARRAAVARVLLSLPVSAFVAYLTWKFVGEVIAPTAGLVCTAVAAVALEALTLATIREQWGDPLLLVGRVTGGVHGVVVKGGQTPGPRDMAVTWLEHGYVRTFEVEIDEALALRAGGSLEPVTTWSGETRLGARRSLHRTAVPGEDCVLVCAGDGAAMLQLGDLAAAPARRRPDVRSRSASRRCAPSRRAS